MQDWSFTYDEAGNLRTRARSMPTELADSIESFGYDSLDRPTTAGTNYPSAPWLNGTDSYEYDYSGNITKKNGNPYTYGNCNAGPHAVCSVGGIDQFVYDANGNMTSGNHRTVGYNPSNKPIHIESQLSSLPGSTTATVDFIYAIVVPEVCRDLTGWVPEFHGNSVRACSGGLAVDWRDVKTAVWMAGWQLPLNRNPQDSAPCT